MLDDESYMRRMEFKKAIYASNHIRLIDVTDHDLTSPNSFLSRNCEKNFTQPLNQPLDSFSAPLRLWNQTSAFIGVHPWLKFSGSLR